MTFRAFSWKAYSDGGGASGEPTPSVSAMAAVDLDGDGDPDLAMARADRSSVSVVFNHSRRGSPDRDLNGVPDECQQVLETPFRRGDANEDGDVDLSDAVRILNFLFLGTGGLRCRAAADTTDDGRISITDAVRLLFFLFWLSDEYLPPPALGCGADPTPDGLGCESHPPCG